MPSLSRGEMNSESRINWFTRVDSVLTDMYSMEFRILDIEDGLPGTQIFPVVEDDWEDVTAAPGKFSTGGYYAYDNVAGAGWTPSLTATLGTHRIEWRWKVLVGASYQYGQEDFEVIIESAGSSADTYISLEDVRTAGLPATVITDDVVLAAILTWQEFIDRACRQWFIPKTLTLNFDGTDSDTIHLGVPIISIDYVKLNGDTTELDTDLYKVYNGITYPDDRKNPRIKLIRTTKYRDIWTGGQGPLKFRKGRQNQEISGIFGYTEADGSVPAMIKRALTKLVIEKVTRPLYVDPATATTPTPPPPIVGQLIEEWTDGHTLKWAQQGGVLTTRAPGLTGITNDQEILDIIRLFRAPIGIATPNSWSY